MKNFTSILFFFFIFFSCDSNDIPSKTESNEPPVIDEPIEDEVDEEEDAFIIVRFPDDFVRDAENLIMVLSNENGEFIDSKIYSNNNKNLIFLNDVGISSSEKFMLTFITFFEGNRYGMHIYTNLTKSSVGDEIIIKPRGNRLMAFFLNIEVPFVQSGRIINAAGDGYSMVKISGNSIQGHFTPKYSNDLGPDNIFIKYYNPFDPYEYLWALIPNIEDVSLLNESDLSNENVKVRQLSTNVVSELPLLQIQGFDNETLFNAISGHRIFDDYLQNYGYSSNHYYSYPDVFHNTVYSLAFSNYSLFGVGLPPLEVNVPNEQVNASITDKKIVFEGVENFEVGRVQLKASSIDIDVIFNGTSTNINLPEIPVGLLPQDITNKINNVDLDLIQVVTENYKSFDDYEDYISNVFKTSTPFYISSPERERVFKSFVGPQIYPMTEFPYFTLFR